MSLGNGSRSIQNKLRNEVAGRREGLIGPAVTIPIHTQHYALLQRNLLYTAITGGRKLAVLVGARKAIAIAVNRVDSRRRVTLLKERLCRPQSLRRSVAVPSAGL
jgi:hypothetical protein